VIRRKRAIALGPTFLGATLTYALDEADYKGLMFYEVGITVTSSSLFEGSVSYATDRSSYNSLHTSNGLAYGEYVQFDLGASRTVILSDVTVQQGTKYDRKFTGLTVYGSNNGSSWTQISAAVTGMTTTAGVWATIASTDTATAYRYIRIQQTAISSQGDHYFCLGEAEFYGTLVAV
jgi:hypothetical protein